MIYARPSATFTALLSGVDAGLVGTLTAGIENLDGTTEVAAASTSIVEVAPGVYVATRTAPADSGGYVVVWNDGTTTTGEELQVTEVLPAPTETGATPSVDDVAALVRARTKPTDGQVPLGTFTTNTRPTAVQVQALIAQAVSEVGARVGTIAEAQESQARHVAALYAAMLVELSYFPEQINDDQSPYDRLKALYDQAIEGLLSATLGNSPRKGLYSVAITTPEVSDAAA